MPSNKSRAKKWCFHCSQWLTKQSHFSRVKLNLAPATCPRKSNCMIFSPAKRLFENFWTLKSSFSWLLKFYNKRNEDWRAKTKSWVFQHTSKLTPTIFLNRRKSNFKITQNTKNAESQDHDILRTRNIILLTFWNWILFRKVNAENLYLVSYII